MPHGTGPRLSRARRTLKGVDEHDRHTVRMEVHIVVVTASGVQARDLLAGGGSRPGAPAVQDVVVDQFQVGGCHVREGRPPRGPGRPARGAIQEATRSSIWLIADEAPSTTPMSNTC